MEKTKEQLRSEITAIEADTASLQSQIDRHKSKKSSFVYRTKISKNKNEIENLKEEIHHLNLKINELNSRIDHNKKRINRLFTEMTAAVKQEAKG